jgi:hypothetical protein
MVGLQPPRLDTIPSYRYALECQIRMHPARFFLSPLTFGCISRLCCRIWRRFCLVLTTQVTSDSQAGLRITGRILTMSSCLGSAPGIIVCAQCSQRCSVFTHYTTPRTHTHTHVSHVRIKPTGDSEDPLPTRKPWLARFAGRARPRCPAVAPACACWMRFALNIWHTNSGGPFATVPRTTVTLRRAER